MWLARPKTASDAQFEAADARRRATRARASARARMERAIAAATAPLTLRDLTGGVPDRPQTAPAPLGSPDSRGGHADALGQPNLNLNLNRNPEVRSARRINALTPSLMAFERVPSRGSIARFHKVERAATRERMKESRSIHSQLTAKRVQEQIQRAGFRPLQRKAAPSETQLGTMPGARPMRATPGMRSTTSRRSRSRSGNTMSDKKSSGNFRARCLCSAMPTARSVLAAGARFRPIQTRLLERHREEGDLWEIPLITTRRDPGPGGWAWRCSRP